MPEFIDPTPEIAEFQRKRLTERMAEVLIETAPVSEDHAQAVLRAAGFDDKAVRLLASDALEQSRAARRR